VQISREEGRGCPLLPHLGPMGSTMNSPRILMRLPDPACEMTAHVPREPALRQELLTRRVLDQAVRDALLRFCRADLTPHSALLARVRASDAANADWLKRVIARHGWPGRALVGVDGSDAAFLIVQHATHDPAFMVASLSALEGAVAAGEASPVGYALLFDRVAVQAGRPQRFGTQASVVDGRVVFPPIEDPAHVDGRRTRFGLPSLAGYERLLSRIYTAPRNL
jgi:hypothetical protein